MKGLHQVFYNQSRLLILKRYNVRKILRNQRFLGLSGEAFGESEQCLDQKNKILQSEWPFVLRLMKRAVVHTRSWYLLTPASIRGLFDVEPAHHLLY